MQCLDRQRPRLPPLSYLGVALNERRQFRLVSGRATQLQSELPDADHFSRWLLSDFEDDGETVMLAPADGFYATPGLGKDEVRIAFVLNADAMRRSIRILGKALVAYPGA